MSHELPNANQPATPAEKEGPTAISLLRRIRTRDLASASLSGDDRRACVEFLSGDGHSNPEIAEILGVSTRTIARDRKKIREANALQPDPGLPAEMAGRLVQDADRIVGKLLRVAKDKATPPAVQVDALRSAWRVFCELTDKLQTLGYLPRETQKLQAELTHHLGQVPSMEFALAEVSRLEAIRKGTLGDDRAVEAELRQTRGIIATLDPTEAEPTSDVEKKEPHDG